MTKRLLTLLAASVLLAAPSAAQNALYRMRENIRYDLEGQAVTAVHANPFWLQANRYGMGSVKNFNAYAQAGFYRDPAVDSTYKWSIGYGVDAVLAANHTSFAMLRQAYVDVNVAAFHFSAGIKERAPYGKNARLSTGSQTFGINARPIPEVRFEIPDYWTPFRSVDWLAIKGHFGYGVMLDTWFEKEHLKGGLHYGSYPLYHSKAGYMRLGDTDRIPVGFEIGLETATIFGGNAHNVSDTPGYNYSIGYGPMQFLRAIYGGGHDASDGEGYGNIAGNMLGSWNFALSARIGGWRARAYYDHFFEDHSQLFMEYGWRDGLCGLEVTPPRNPFVKALVLEYISTKDQSGPVYHDHTEAIPKQVSGVDNYYNHIIYQGWQYWGQAIGNPLFYTALYDDDRTLAFKSNRFQGWHIGIEGEPSRLLSYRLLATHTKHYGTYQQPFSDVKHNTSLLCEVGLRLPEENKRTPWLAGWSVNAGIGVDRGNHLGNNVGGLQLTLRKTGWLRR